MKGKFGAYVLWPFEHALILATLDYTHYHLEVQANPKKNGTKKPMPFLASMGETGIS